MKIEHNPIRTQEQYEAVVSRMEQLKDAEAGTPEAEELKLLTRLIVALALQVGNAPFQLVQAVNFFLRKGAVKNGYVVEHAHIRACA